MIIDSNVVTLTQFMRRQQYDNGIVANVKVGSFQPLIMASRQ